MNTRTCTKLNNYKLFLLTSSINENQRSLFCVWVYQPRQRKNELTLLCHASDFLQVHSERMVFFFLQTCALYQSDALAQRCLWQTALPRPIDDWPMDMHLIRTCMAYYRIMHSRHQANTTAALLRPNTLSPILPALIACRNTTESIPNAC